MPLVTVSNKLIAVFVFSCLVACQSIEQEEHVMDSYQFHVPDYFPDMFIPEDNPMSWAAVELGRELFFDPVLSADYKVSCASCHFPAYAFSDTVPISSGVHPDRMGRRNAYPLANVGFLKALFMEGGVPSLELQVLAPLGERNEMDLQIRDAVLRMKENPRYVSLATEAYDREIDPWVITRALAAYERTLISADSPFDRYYYGKDTMAISPAAIEGWEIFQELKCNTCHSGPLFTDETYQNIGMYESYEDPGRERLTDKEEDHGKFRVPSLRNVALTAPYMHDGSMKTLEEVIAHFSRGGEEHPNKSELIRSFSLDKNQERKLVAFLESLTDSTFITNKHYLPRNLRRNDQDE